MGGRKSWGSRGTLVTELAIEVVPSVKLEMEVLGECREED
jgi:hypothetical protein